MLVFDSSAYINGRRDHLPPATFPTVWARIEEALEDHRILLPREVFVELRAKDDDTAEWIKQFRAVDPIREVQAEVGAIYAAFSNGSARRDGADPFVIAEARHRGLTVVTYEGRSFSGIPTRRWERSMPGHLYEVRRPVCHAT